MPLPDADNPKTSNLYAQLRTSQLETIEPDNFEKVKHPVYVNADNEDEARRLKLWGELGGQSSSSGPFLGSGMVHLVSLDSGDTGHQTVWQPDKGQIWQICTLSVKPIGGGTINCSVSLEDSTTAARVVVDTGASGTGAVIIDVVNGPLLISNECFLSFYFSSQGTSGSEISIAAYLVR